MTGELIFKPCRECGAPRLAGRILEWKSDGTIVSHVGKSNRVVILDSRIYNTVFDNAEKSLGFAVWEIAFDTTRNVTKSVIDELPARFPGLRPLVSMGVMHRTVVGFLKIYSRIAGHSAPELVEYKAGKYAVARIRNPIDIEIVAGTMLGSLEALNGVPCIHKIEKESENQFLVRVEPLDNGAGRSDLTRVEFPAILPGNIFYERCRRCGVPRNLSARLEWDHEEGTILELLTGTRFCMVSYTIKTVLGELAGRYGETAYDFLVEAQRILTIEHVKSRGDTLRPESSYDDILRICRNYMDDWSLFGYGNPVLFKIEGDSMEAVVENPFDIHLLAGTLLGLYDALFDRKRAINWYVPKDGVVSYAIEPV
ncbi:MAG: hypothetical protein JXA49_00845 [Actinobacteria bacterium]|nr:hypothetical protein [Actinomycetota bacterium]